MVLLKYLKVNLPLLNLSKAYKLQDVSLCTQRPLAPILEELGRRENKKSRLFFITVMHKDAKTLLPLLRKG